MKTYLARVQRTIAEQEQKQQAQTNEIASRPSQELAEKLKQYISTLSHEQQKQPLYEVDILSMFGCDKQTLAIATYQLGWHAERVWLNGVKILGYWSNKAQ